MNGASRSTRRCKREMAVASVDDEPTSSKRAANSAKGDETEYGPSYAELQEMNRKLTESLESVLRVAHEKELRASKRVMELETTVASLKNELEEERKQRSEERERDGKKIDELTFQVAKYALRLEEPSQLQPVVAKEPEQQPLSLQQLLAGATPALAVQQPQPIVDKASEEQPLTLQQLLQQESEEAARAPAGKKLHESGHPNNILQMCRPDMPYSMPIADAAVKLSGPYRRCGQGNFLKNCYVARGMKFPCEACGRTFNKFSFLCHFFTDAHVEKVHSHGGAVSADAVNYWVRVLSAVAAPKMQRTRAAGGAARAAAAGLARSPAEIAAKIATAAAKYAAGPSHGTARPAAKAAAAAGLRRRRSPTDAAASLRAAAALAAAGPSRAAVRQAAAYTRLAAKAAEAATAPKKIKKEENEE